PVRLALRHLLQSTSHALGLDEPGFRDVFRFVCASLRHGHLDRLAIALNGMEPPRPRNGGPELNDHPRRNPMPDYQTHEYDVLVIGAGGAGLRAAIEASAAGVKVGMICKSLLGKAHTVMAEGGIAAALGNVDERDNWKVHFADTMRGGQYVN